MSTPLIHWILFGEAMKKKASYSRLSFKRLGRTVKKSPLQFLAMVLILLLTTTLFTGFYASYVGLDTRMSNYYEKSNMADIWTTTLIDPETATKEIREKDYNDIVNASSAYNGVVESRYYNQAKLDGQNGYICLSDKFPTICTPYQTDNVETEKFFIIDERFNKGEGLKEFQINMNVANLNSYISRSSRNVKEILTKHLKEGKSNIFDGDTLLIGGKITGYMSHPENVLYSSDVTWPIFLMSRSCMYEALNKLITDTYTLWELPDGASESEKIAHNLVSNPKESIIDKYWYDNQYLTRLKNRADTNKVKEVINKTFDSRSSGDNHLLTNVDLNNLESNKNITMDLIQTRKMAFAFPAIFFLVSILVVSTTISQIIIKERNEIGTLRALGASSKSIAFHYILLDCLVGFIGVALGAILGPFIMPPIMEFKYWVSYALPPQIFVYPTVAAIGIIVAVLGIIALVSYLTARKEAKQLPAISMRPKVVKKNKHLLKTDIADKTSKNKTTKICFKMAIRNIFLSSTRSIMVILGVLGCTGLLCCGFGIDDAVDYGIQHDMNSYFNADAMVLFSSGGQETIDALDQLKVEHKISKYDALSLLPVTCQKAGINDTSFTTQIYSLSPGYKESKFINIGDYQVHNNKVAITSKVANALNLHVNDFINFSFLGENYHGEVGVILESFYAQGVFIDGNYPKYPYFLTSPTVFVRYHPEADKTEALNSIKAIQGVSDVTTYEQMVKNNNNAVSAITYITLLVKAFAILLAAIVLYNLALLNFKENIRNIATMKVLGFTRQEIAKSLIMEIMILTGIGIIFGLAIGFPLEILILSINTTPMNEFIYYISPLAFLFSFLITVLVSFGINYYLGFKSKKVKMVESLKSVE